MFVNISRNGMANVDFFCLVWYDRYEHGRVFVDNDLITIYADDIEIAQNICSSISDGDMRNRAVANVLAVKLAERYFNSNNIQNDAATGLHKIQKVIENIDIADIYLNGAYIDVRVYFSNDELSIPKFHFDLDINPAAYMFIKLNTDLSGYKVAGFIRPENIDKNNLKEDYYYVSEKYLVSYYDIESYLPKVPESFSYSKEMLYSFVDGTINDENIAKLLQVLVTSAGARKTLAKAFKASTLFRFVSAVPEKTPVISENTETNKEAGATETELDEMFDGNNKIDSEDLYNSLEFSTEVTPNITIDEEQNEAEDTPDNSDQIDSLFKEEQKAVPLGKKSGSSKKLFVLIILLAAACGLYAFINTALNKNALPSEDMAPAITADADDNISPEQLPEDSLKKEDAMPDETVNESSSASNKTEEVSSVSIPAIEQHLDASVLVSNLKVDWEVPAGYASNTSAKRYLIKLGKVIQLNLKSELLLLTRPPISNRITVELTYNANSGKFEIVGLKDSSGEKSVDEVILSTIKNATNISTSSNIESFGKLQGNPVLIIHL